MPSEAKAPGQLLKLKFNITITISIALTIAVAILTYLYVTRPSWHSALEFSGAAVGVAAGMLSAYYIGRGLKITIEQRDTALKDEKISRAFVYLQRWNEPSFAAVRSQWRELVDEIEGKSDPEICAILKISHPKRTTTADVLNFFEEVSYAARSGVADVETLRFLLRSVVERYFSAIWPWVEHRRTTRHQPTLYEHFEWLREQWKS